MDYKINMPILSDTMEKGKLIKWHVKEGDVVKKGDVIAEVESDKAIMEIQTFKDGVVKKLLAKEGEEIPVKEPIAVIEVEVEEKEISKEAEKVKSGEGEKEISGEAEKEKRKEEKEIREKEEKIPKILEEILEPHIKVSGIASAAAKKEAQKANIDIEKLQKENILPKPAHLKDIEEEVLKRYFTPKAIKLLKEYNLGKDNFVLDHKIGSEEVKEYIKKNNIPKILKLSKNRLAVIKNVEISSKKPFYYIFETFNIKKYEGYKLTSLLLKTIGDVMQSHPLSRAALDGDSYKIYPHSNISVAVAKDDELYMVVCKNVEEKSLDEIDEWVRSIKDKKYTIDDLSGSTFGISNLGMFGIKSFTALINQKDSGIAAFGRLEDDKIEVSFTFDHRIFNGVDAAKFVSDLKEKFSEI